MSDKAPVKLRIPRQDLTTFSYFPLTGADAAQWAAGLPVTSAREVAQTLATLVGELNRVVLPAAERYAILEAIRPNMNVAVASLTRKVINQPLVMPEEPRQLAEIADQLLGLSSTAYTLVAVHALRDRDNMAGVNPARLMCEALQRAINLTAGKIFQHFLLYQPGENRAWQTLHQLYHLAERQHLTRLRVDDGHEGITTVQATWLRPLLLSCCKPNQVRQGDLIAILLPDMVQPAVFEQDILPNAKAGASILFAHGFNVHFGQIEVPDTMDVIMVAPKGPGDLVRRQYQEGKGVPSLMAIEQDASGEAFDRTLAYAHGIGGTRGGVITTSFKEETETDLFGEQAVLCGGATELVVKGWETLVEAGYQPEVAYFECLHELKLIVDLLFEGGLAKMNKYISETAQYGDFTRGPRIINDETKQRMKVILEEIQNGTFAKQWSDEYAQGLGEFRRMEQEDYNHPIEKVGAALRAQMSWINADDDEGVAETKSAA